MANLRRVLLTVLAASAGCATSPTSPPLRDSTVEFRLVSERAEHNTVPMLHQSPWEQKTLHVQKHAHLCGRDLSGARVAKGRGPNRGLYSVQLTLKPESAAKLEELTSRNMGKRLAIIIDGEVLTAPVIAAPIRGTAVSLGLYIAKARASELARRINGAVR